MAMAPIDFNITVPQPNLAPYLQARAVNLANIQQSIGQLGGTIAQVVAGAQQQEQQRQAQMQLASDVSLLQRNLTPENLMAFRTAHPDREDITKAFAERLVAREQQAAAIAAQQQKAADFMAARRTGNFDEYFLKYSEDRKELYPIVNDERRNAVFSDFAPIVSALQRDDVQTSNDIVNRMIVARQTSKDQAGAEALKNLLVDTSLPYVEQKKKAAQALETLGVRLAALDPERFKEIRESVTQGAIEATRARAMSEQEVEKAKQAVIESGLLGEKIMGEIKKDKAQTAALWASAGLTRATEQLKLREIELSKIIDPIERQKKQAELDKARLDVENKVKEENFKLENARTMSSDFLSMAKKLKDTPRNVKENALGTIDAWLFAPEAPLGAFVFPETANFQENVRGLTSKQFTQAVATQGSMVGLSEKEGQELKDAISNLSLRQDVDQFNENVDSVIRLVEKINSMSEKRFGPRPEQNKVNVGMSSKDLFGAP